MERQQAFLKKRGRDMVFRDLKTIDQLEELEEKEKKEREEKKKEERQANAFSEPPVLDPLALSELDLWALLDMLGGMLPASQSS